MKNILHYFVCYALLFVIQISSAQMFQPQNGAYRLKASRKLGTQSGNNTYYWKDSAAYEYSSSGWLTKMTYFMRANHYSPWGISYYSIYNYDLSSPSVYEVRTNYSTKFSNDQSFNPVRRISKKYNTTGALILEINESYSQYTSAFINVNKTEYEYDNKNRLIYIKNYTVDATNNYEFIIKDARYNFYVGNSSLIDSTTYLSNGHDVSTSSKNFYNTEGLLLRTNHYLNEYNSGTYVLEYYIINEYDSFNNLISQKFFYNDYDSGLFLNTKITSNEYSSNLLVKKTLISLAPSSLSALDTTSGLIYKYTYSLNRNPETLERYVFKGNNNWEHIYSENFMFNDGNYLTVKNIESLKENLNYFELYSTDELYYELIPNVSTIEPAENIKLNIFPNPTTSVLNINIDNNFTCNYYIYSVSGMVQRSGQLTGENKSLLVTDLNSGVYFLRIIGKDIDQSLKFIKM